MLNLGHLHHFRINNVHVQTNYFEVVVLQQGDTSPIEQLVKKRQVEKKVHTQETEILGEIKKSKTPYMFYVIAIVSEFAVGVKDGLDECEKSPSLKLCPNLTLGPPTSFC